MGTLLVTSAQAPWVPDTCVDAQLAALEPVGQEGAAALEAVAVNATPVTLALLTVTVSLAGEKVYPASDGVSVYEPFARPAIVNAPVALVVADALPAETVTPASPLPLEVTVPETEYVELELEPAMATSSR